MTSMKSKTKVVISRKFVCDREGVKRDTGKLDNVKEMRERRAVRLDCKAKMVIKLRADKWVVKTFEDIHSHELTSPLKTKMLRSHNQIHKSEGVKVLIDCLNDTQMPKYRIAKAINSTHDGVTGGLSTNQVIAHLRDTDGTFRSMFWADSRARDAYMTFNDVIVFYVTYKTNRLSLPFAPFTGVNHHRQSIIFGSALLADEKEETFSWLFEQWLTCMHGKAPGAIITDMDLAMKNAIKRVFPDTRHRFCEWHIWKHLLEKVVEMRETEGEFYRDYNRCFHSKTIEECENKWQVLVGKYEIGGNEWLCRMWEQREHWMRAYWRTTFTTGMKSSQRSESMNSFFDGYVNNNTSLHEFLNAYERALDGLKGGTNCWYDLLSNEGTVEEVQFDDSDGVTATCECTMFEMEGILCQHILRIFYLKQLRKVPERYMLRRWSIEARYRGEVYYLQAHKRIMA
ncbi:protein FAR1-RELATED SEQUENCE 5-like [Tasmannia lanceolata]|uniref:protein FAR1-RELATED SEQUENCE 5-like n=1 Tax=Tasmannia lanceolata TaxID=3420 RepID=UPI004063EED2